MVLLSIGLNTPSLRLRESNATLQSKKFNIQRDIPKNFVDGRYVLQPNCDLVTYVHLMFDRHEIVISEGVPSESLYPGPCAMDSLTAPARREIMKIFPELSAGTQSFGPLAATELRAHEARIMFAA
jgi:hypothetical protein